MQMIGNLWWLWLISLAVFGAYVVFNQIRRIKGMVNSDNVEQALDCVGKGITTMYGSVALVALNGILLTIAVLVNIFGTCPAS